MDTREQGLANLKEILDRLGPGAWLRIDDRWLIRLFDSEIDVAFDAATEFAKRNHCTLRYDQEKGIGEFGRAYFQPD